MFTAMIIDDEKTVREGLHVRTRHVKSSLPVVIQIKIR
jgi:YesN/AraC family two-component response regulator